MMRPYPKQIPVFVYGTLKSQGQQVRDMSNMAGAVMVGDASTVAGCYSMLDLNAFPGVILGGDHNILGEVWYVTPTTLNHLDMIEGYPDFYDRQWVDTTMGPAWMYMLPDSWADNYPRIDPNPQGLLEW